jgi:hypothetical protein
MMNRQRSEALRGLPPPLLPIQLSQTSLGLIAAQQDSPGARQHHAKHYGAHHYWGAIFQ